MKKTRAIISLFISCALLACFGAPAAFSVPSYASSVASEPGASTQDGTGEDTQTPEDTEQPAGQQQQDTSESTADTSKDKTPKTDSSSSAKTKPAASGASTSSAASDTGTGEKEAVVVPENPNKSSGTYTDDAGEEHGTPVSSNPYSDKAASLESLTSQMNEARQNYKDVVEQAAKAKASKDEEQDEYAEEVKKNEQKQERAQSVIDAVEEEKAASSGVGIAEVLAGEAAFEDLDSREYLLDKIAEDQEKTLADARKEGEQLKKSKKKGGAARVEKADSSKSKELDKQKAAAIEKGNEIAMEIERAASGARGSGTFLVERYEALDAAAAWYDFVDSLSDTTDSLTFGTGADFALSEEKFVNKWGAAIDRFYESYQSQSGYLAPLHGYGKTMAAAAYKYKMDPRLCAAVSIIESGGGKYCIKSCNAWGWGAADSDPYGGASAWSSWESAIDEWHYGVSHNKYGMSTAGTVDELGAIYCTGTAWSGDAAGYMEQISSLAE